jgi:hypothetical protein
MAIALYMQFRIEMLDIATYLGDASLREEGLIDGTTGLADSWPRGWMAITRTKLVVGFKMACG